MILVLMMNSIVYKQLKCHSQTTEPVLSCLKVEELNVEGAELRDCAAVYSFFTL